MRSRRRSARTSNGKEHTAEPTDPMGPDGVNLVSSNCAASVSAHDERRTEEAVKLAKNLLRVAKACIEHGTPLTIEAPEKAAFGYYPKL